MLILFICHINTLEESTFRNRLFYIRTLQILLKLPKTLILFTSLSSFTAVSSNLICLRLLFLLFNLFFHIFLIRSQQFIVKKFTQLFSLTFLKFSLLFLICCLLLVFHRLLLLPNNILIFLRCCCDLIILLVLLFLSTVYQLLNYIAE